MFLERWNPAPGLSLFSDFGRLFDEAFTPFTRSANGEGSFAITPALEVTESDDAFAVRLELPGVGKEDVHVSLDDDVLTIKGEKRHEKKEEAGRVVTTEHVYGLFERALRLPETVDVDKLDARHADGVLTVTLPKREEARPVRRELKVK